VRSDLVFTANSRVSNRFLLCHFVRLATKAFHKDGVAVHETINRVLTTMGQQKQQAVLPNPKGAKYDAADFGRTELADLEMARAALKLMAAHVAPATP
jgi:hypothetical protein